MSGRGRPSPVPAQGLLPERARLEAQDGAEDVVHQVLRRGERPEPRVPRRVRIRDGDDLVAPGEPREARRACIRRYTE